MQEVLTSRQMQLTDQYTREGIGMPSLVLMERAALACYERIMAMTSRQSRILCLCGQGGNGGDGYAAARLLRRERPHTEVCFVGNPARISPDCRHQRSLYLKLGGSEISEPVIEHYDLIVDGIYGVGLSRPIAEPMCRLFARINAAPAKVISLDLPSGINGDNGQICGGALQADETVTFQFLKYGHLLFPGRAYSGHVTVANIGIELDPDMRIDTFTATPGDMAEQLPKRYVRSHKGIYGKCLIAAGRKDMAGCAVLSGKAALAMGCGLMRIFSPEENRIILQQSLPEGLYTSYEQDHPDSEKIRQTVSWASGAGIGPGIGTDKQARDLLLHLLRHAACPLVLDADALTIISTDDMVKEAVLSCCQQIVMTPHPAEMARLLNLDVSYIREHPAECAGKAAEEYRSIIVLKDATTLVTDGDTLYLNTTGCDGMATAGSGDVLTGMIASLLAQGMTPLGAARLGVYLHGLAGEKAQALKGPRSMLAGDISLMLPSVLDEI